MKRNEMRILSQVAREYYLEGKTQLEIANKLCTSRPRINRLLKQARELGIVKIDIRDPGGRCRDLEAMLRNQFDLDFCAVVSGSKEIARAGMIEAAAELVDSLVQPKLTLGVSWGTTLRDVAQALPRRRVNTLEVLTMAGGFPSGVDQTSSTDIARLIAEAYGGTYFGLNAPAIVRDHRTWDALMREPDIRDTLAKAAQVKVALTGIGAAVPTATILNAGYFQSSEFLELQRQGVAGDFYGIFLDAYGREIKPSLPQRSLSISLEELKAIPTVICVAGGFEKARAVLAGLRGGYIDKLVTDEDVATQIETLIRTEGVGV